MARNGDNIDAAVIFAQLEGTWHLHRELQSTNTAEPSGKCTGVATFTSREPSVFVDKDGQLQTANAELVYHEQGHFELYQAISEAVSVPRFPFSRKYIWRLQRSKREPFSTISVWFAKPGSEIVDYLFHKVDFQPDGETLKPPTQTGQCVEATACHLCEDDFYSSSYTFQLDHNISHHMAGGIPHLQHWMMIHEVRGPNKDQYIETKFTRSASTSTT